MDNSDLKADLRESIWLMGLSENEVLARLSGELGRYERVHYAIRTEFPQVEVILSAQSGDSKDFYQAANWARQSLGLFAYPPEISRIASATLVELRKIGATLAVAESCTGGLVSDLLTDEPGSSDSFVLGVVAYRRSAKQSLLGVSPSVIDKHGEVSREVVSEMASGARSCSGATFGLGLSGIAGPGGGTPQKPVGTIWLGGSGPGWEESRCLHLPYDRRRNKLMSAHLALDLLRRHLLAGV